MHLDLYIVRKVSRFVGKSHIATCFFRDVARYGHVLFLLYGLCLWFWPGENRSRYRLTAVSSFLGVFMASLISLFIGRLWKRKRPFLQDRQVQNVTQHRATPSFPSNHAMNSLAIAWGLFHGRVPGRFLLGFWAILLAFSRVATGVHFLTDIIGGWLVACMVSSIVYQRRAQVLLRGVTAFFSYISDRIFSR